MGRKGASCLRVLIVSALVTSICFFLYRNGDDASSESLNLVSPAEPAQADEYIQLPSHAAEVFAPIDEERKDYHDWNTQTMRELHACIALQNCGRNQQKIALLASHWFSWGVVRNWRGGEGVWGESIYKNLRAQGYTTLFAETFEEAVDQYRQFPDLVKVVIRHWAGQCYSNPNCVKGPSNPRGIPAWKIFDLEFFPVFDAHEHGSPMKGKWILSANPHQSLSDDDSPVQYIGYSIEDECRKITPVPLSSRSNQAWLLMKQIKYVYDNRFAWDRTFFSRAAQELKIKFIGAWSMDQYYGAWDPEKDGEMKNIEDRDHGVINLGDQLIATEFMKQVGMSKVMVGVGNPYWSPSPYDALCQGVPFINPIIYWDHNDPWRKAGWNTQHPSLNQLDPPYVYNIHARNWTGFVEAIQAASATEIPSFIPEHMTEVAVQGRLEKLMETDWRSLAAKLLEDRLQKLKDGKNAYTFEL